MLLTHTSPDVCEGVGTKPTKGVQIARGDSEGDDLDALGLDDDVDVDELLEGTVSSSSSSKSKSRTRNWTRSATYAHSRSLIYYYLCCPCRFAKAARAWQRELFSLHLLRQNYERVARDPG